tara:strand:- start:644 stop:904 length:261 start_codon:yes stop_codon:yes gene_type:complete
MYRMLFEDPDNPEREDITNVIADCIDELSNQEFDDKEVVECGLKYLLTLAYLMTTVESVDELIESIKASALVVKEEAMKTDRKNLN